jgi:hypothetical protein
LNGGHAAEIGHPRMKPHHAAALALVRQYLMVPQYPGSKWVVLRHRETGGLGLKTQARILRLRTELY